jgi:hypothetical protein
MALKRPQFPLSVPDTPDTSPVSESGPLPKINTSNVRDIFPPMILANLLLRLAQLSNYPTNSVNCTSMIWNR